MYALFNSCLKANISTKDEIFYVSLLIPLQVINKKQRMLQMGLVFS